MRRSLLVVLAVGCGAAQQPAATERPLGAAMVEVGMRFTRIGQEVLAARWDLAQYDLGELDEVFVRDLAHHSWHGNGKLRQLSSAFAAGPLPAMRDAVRNKDLGAFRKSAADAVKACNDCHVAGNDAFIEVPLVLGAPSPVITQP
jgi:hypothetical protein